MSGMQRLVLVVLVALVGAVAVPGVADAKKKKPTTCDLLTKKQVSKVLGFKVVETSLEADKASGAEQCEYATNKYWNEDFEGLDAPYKLQVTTQPLAGVEDTLDTLESDDDAETVPGLGDRAFYTDGNDLVVVVGDVVLMTEITNIAWSGSELDTYVRQPERKAMDLLVPLFEATSKKR